MNESMKSAYMEKLNAQLKEWSAKFEVVKAKGAQVAADVKVDYQKQLEDWKTKESALRKKLEELKSSGLDKFEVLKSGTETLWADLKTTIEKLTEKK